MYSIHKVITELLQQYPTHDPKTLNTKPLCFIPQIGELVPRTRSQTVLPLDDHSKVVPLLPISNRTVKHLSADDSG